MYVILAHTGECFSRKDCEEAFSEQGECILVLIVVPVLPPLKVPSGQ